MEKKILNCKKCGKIITPIESDATSNLCFACSKLPDINLSAFKPSENYMEGRRPESSPSELSEPNYTHCFAVSSFVNKAPSYSKENEAKYEAKKKAFGFK